VSCVIQSIIREESAVGPYSYLGGGEFKSCPGAGYSGRGSSWFSQMPVITSN